MADKAQNTAGAYTYTGREQATGSPAVTDPTEPYAATPQLLRGQLELLGTHDIQGFQIEAFASSGDAAINPTANDVESDRCWMEIQNLGAGNVYLNIADEAGEAGRLIEPSPRYITPMPVSAADATYYAHADAAADVRLTFYASA